MTRDGGRVALPVGLACVGSARGEGGAVLFLMSYRSGCADEAEEEEALAERIEICK